MCVMRVVCVKCVSCVSCVMCVSCESCVSCVSCVSSVCHVCHVCVFQCNVCVGPGYSVVCDVYVCVIGRRRKDKVRRVVVSKNNCTS